MGELIDFLVQRDENFRPARLPALYSDFRSQKFVNPDGFQANICAWRTALARAAWEGQTPDPTATSHLVVNLNEKLLSSLESRHYGRPLALGIVVEEAMADKHFLPLTVFLRSKDTIYGRRSWTHAPWDLVSWTVRQLGLSTTSSREDWLPVGQFVAVVNVETAAKTLVDRLPSSSSRVARVFTRAHFQKLYLSSLAAGQPLSDLDANVLLTFMSRDKIVIAYDGQIVKVLGPEPSDNTVTEEDRAIASLNALIDDLRRQSSSLSTRVEELSLEAKNAVSQHRTRVVSVAILRSKRMAETVLASRLTTLGQLEEVARKIEQASDQIQLIRIVEASTTVLQQLNTRTGSAERAHQVMDSMREKIQNVDELGNIIAAPGQDVVEVDEDEIDLELQAIEKQERKRLEDVMKAEKVTAEADIDLRLHNQLQGLIPAPTNAPEGDIAMPTSHEVAPAVSEDLSHGLRRLSLIQAETN